MRATRPGNLAKVAKTLLSNAWFWTVYVTPRHDMRSDESLSMSGFDGIGLGVLKVGLLITFTGSSVSLRSSSCPQLDLCTQSNSCSANVWSLTLTLCRAELGLG